MPKIDIWGRQPEKGIWERGSEGAKTDLGRMTTATISIRSATIHVARGTINFSGVAGIPGFSRSAASSMATAQDEKRSADYLKRLYGLQYGRDPNFVGGYGPQTMASIAKNIKMLNQRVGMHPAGPSSLTPWAMHAEEQRQRGGVARFGRRVLGVAGIGGGLEMMGGGAALGAVGEIAAPIAGVLAAPAVAGAVVRLGMDIYKNLSPAFISAGIWSKAMQAAAPYLNLRVGAAALGRAGGFSSRALGSAILPGHYATPGWMAATGLGPQDVISAIQGLGVVPRSTAEALGAARTIGMLRNISPSFAGLPAGAISGMLSQGLGMGLTGFGGLSNYASSIKPAMDAARQSDADRLKILQSIESTLRDMARGGSMIGGAGSVASFYARMMATGLPAARTGELQQSIASGISNMMGNPFSSPIRAMTAVAIEGRYGGLRTEADIDRFLGTKQAAAMKARSPAAYRYYVRMITGEKIPALRAYAAYAMGNGDIVAQQHILDAARATFRTGSPVANLAAISAATGISFPEAAAYEAAPRHGGPAGLPTAPGNVPTTALMARAKSQEAGIRAAQSATSAFVPAANVASSALSAASKVLGDAAAAVSRLGAAAAGAAAGAPAPQLVPYHAAQ